MPLDDIEKYDLWCNGRNEYLKMLDSRLIVSQNKNYATFSSIVQGI
jgi:hypothetical protein